MRVVRLLVVGLLVAATAALWVWWPSAASEIAVDARLSNPVPATAPTVKSPPDVPALPPTAQPEPVPEDPAAAETDDAAEAEEAALAELMAEPPMDMVKVLVRSTTGQPCLGAKVRFNRRGLVWPWTVTGADGRCTIEAQRGAQGTVEVEHPYAAGRVEIELATGSRGSELIIPLTLESGALRVRLTRPPGSTPFKGIGLLIPGAGGRARVQQQLRSEDWNLTGLAPGRWTLRVVPAYSPYLPLSRIVDIAPGLAAEIEVALAPGNTLSGIVVDDHGMPVAGVDVKALGEAQGPALAKPQDKAAGRLMVHGYARGLKTGYWSANDDRSYASTRSNEDGTFSFAGFASGDVKLYAVYQGAYCFNETVNANTQDLRIVLPSSPPAIRLVVRRPAGAKARSWEVLARGGKHHSALNSAGGPSFELRGLPAGEYVVWARSRRPEPALSALAVVNVKDGATTTVEVEPQLVATVRCTPLAAEDGVPLKHVWFDYRWRGFIFGPSTSIGGEVFAPPGEDLIVRARTMGRTVVEQPLRLAPGERKDLGEIRFLKK